MRKSILLTTAFVFMLAFAFAGSSYACSSCAAHTAKASCGSKTGGTSAKASCGSKMDGTSADKEIIGSADQMKMESASGKACGADCTKPCCSAKKGILGSAVNTDAMFATATFSVNGMTCAGCESQVSKKLSDQSGVTEVVKISHKNKSAVFTYDPKKVDPSKLAEIVTKMGFKTEVVSTGVDMADAEEKIKTM